MEVIPVLGAPVCAHVPVLLKLRGLRARATVTAADGPKGFPLQLPPLLGLRLEKLMIPNGSGRRVRSRGTSKRPLSVGSCTQRTTSASCTMSTRGVVGEQLG
eukprot:4371858-Pyramimonas_sp.AAC.1